MKVWETRRQSKPLSDRQGNEDQPSLEPVLRQLIRRWQLLSETQRLLVTSARELHALVRAFRTIPFGSRRVGHTAANSILSWDQPFCYPSVISVARKPAAVAALVLPQTAAAVEADSSAIQQRPNRRRRQPVNYPLLSLLRCPTIFCCRHSSSAHQQSSMCCQSSSAAIPTLPIRLP